ncbi:MAG TPA: PD-(D/E)XK nuclease family transposase, partial [Gemmataceae bacterium]|nr:PD-(D/E)XK nuclease family transposase [Gemmataceae bacterium]
HLIELPKFTKDVNLITDPFDAWLYFLRFAEVLDTDALPGALGLPPFRDAMEELRMVTQNDLERERYEARLKVHRDALSLVRELSASQEEAKEALVKGKLIGQKIGVIHLCQRRLNRQLTPHDELTTLPPEELARLADQLEKELFGSPPASSEESRS